MLRLLTLLWLSCFAAMAQEWRACSVWAIPVPVSGWEMQIPTSHSKGTSLCGFMTTTNGPSGDLRGATISATAQITTTNNPQFWFGNDCGSGVRFPNFRLYFTTTTEPYTLAHANANEVEYWWSREVFAQVKGGTVTLTATLDATSAWGDSQGHGADTLPDGFNSAASRVAQIGFSFGGGCFFDTGVGIYNPDDPSSGATFRILDFRIVHPKISKLAVGPAPGNITLGWDYPPTTNYIFFRLVCKTNLNDPQWSVVTNTLLKQATIKADKPDCFFAVKSVNVWGESGFAQATTQTLTPEPPHTATLLTAPAPPMPR